MKSSVHQECTVFGLWAVLKIEQGLDQLICIWHYGYVECPEVFMHRTTILLPNDLRSRAHQRAREMGISFGEFVRAAVGKMTLEPRKKGPQRDPLFSDDYVYKGPVPKDLALNHDAYLYDEKP
jgi:hypothetical protein